MCPLTHCSPPVHRTPSHCSMSCGTRSRTWASCTTRTPSPTAAAATSSSRCSMCGSSQACTRSRGRWPGPPREGGGMGSLQQHTQGQGVGVWLVIGTEEISRLEVVVVALTLSWNHFLTSSPGVDRERKRSYLKDTLQFSEYVF